MAYVHFDQNYAPCAFLIVKDGGNPRDDSDSILIQTDWDWPSVASRMGFVPCECGATDGTVDCEHRYAIDMIEAAIEHVRAHEGESFPCLDEYFPEQE
jgi:hypothetical protein